ncbi:MAG: carbohydrate ABC transporter permease [Acidimicrobiales bacterium]
MTDVAAPPAALGRAVVDARARRARGPGRGTLVRRREQKGMWFVLPFLVMFLMFLITPLGYALYTSLYTTKLVGGTSFSGFANYTQTFQSNQFWSGVVRVVAYAAVQIPVMLVIAFFFATMFDLGIARFGRLFRTIFFIPFAVPAVVGSVMWSFLLDPASGPFTQLAHAIGFSQANYFSSTLIVPTIIVIAIWEWTGYNMMILYTALKSVPREVVEAAVLDGASLWRVILRVKLPMVRPVIVMLVFLNVIGASQLFTEPLILSYFQPQAISDYFTPTLYIYNIGIGGQQYNLAAAAAVVLGVLVVAISVVSLTFRRRGEGLL